MSFGSHLQAITDGREGSERNAQPPAQISKREILSKLLRREWSFRVLCLQPMHVFLSFPRKRKQNLLIVFGLVVAQKLGEGEPSDKVNNDIPFLS